MIRIENLWEDCPTLMSGIYRLHDVSGDVIYIGKSNTCIRQRINAHCFQNPSQYLGKHALENLMKKRTKTHYFSYKAFCDADIEEILEIRKYKPFFNKEFNI